MVKCCKNLFCETELVFKDAALLRDAIRSMLLVIKCYQRLINEKIEVKR